MTNCDNCQAAFNPDEEGLVATERGRSSAEICGSCLKDATLVKLVLRRGQPGGFAYEQFQPLEVRKPAKAAG